MPDNKKEKKNTADAIMRGVNMADLGMQGVLAYEKFRRFAQGNASMLKTANNTIRGYGKLSPYIALGIEAANTAWLANDPDKRKRTEEEYKSLAGKNALERLIEGLLNSSDVIYGASKNIMDIVKINDAVRVAEWREQQKKYQEMSDESRRREGKPYLSKQNQRKKNNNNNTPNPLSNTLIGFTPKLSFALPEQLGEGKSVFKQPETMVDQFNKAIQLKPSYKK